MHTGAWNLLEDMREKGEVKDFLIATPEARSTFYINSKDGKERYEDFLLQEFFPYIEKHYRIAPGRHKRAISGISMGGYGALHLAFRHPEIFSSVSAHSAALIDKLPTFLGARFPQSPRSRVLGGVFGDSARSNFLGTEQPHRPGAQSKSHRPANLFRLRRPGRLRLRIRRHRPRQSPHRTPHLA